jgi:hypothetical protein
LVAQANPQIAELGFGARRIQKRRERLQPDEPVPELRDFGEFERKTGALEARVDTTPSSRSFNVLEGRGQHQGADQREITDACSASARIFSELCGRFQRALPARALDPNSPPHLQFVGANPRTGKPHQLNRRVTIRSLEMAACFRLGRAQ